MADMSKLYKTTCTECGEQITFLNSGGRKICVELESVTAGETEYDKNVHAQHKCFPSTDWRRQDSFPAVFSLVISLLVACPAWARDIVAVHNVTYSGQEYHVVELVKKERERIHWANALRLKRGKEYASYKLSDSAYPLKLPVEEAKKIPELKTVPDDRPFDDKHPYVTRGREAVKSWGPLVSWLIEIAR